MKMKKILALLLVLFVAVTIFAACGEKKDETVNEPEKTEDVAKTEDVTEDKAEDTAEKTEPVAGMFENKLISFALPEGYTAKEDQGTINVSKTDDPLKAITMVVQENNPAPVEEVAKMTLEFLKDSTMEDAKIGNYEYKKIVTSLMGIEVITLITSNNGNLFSITINGLDDPGIASIVESIVLK
jgi:hypothetical protein